MTPKMPKMPEPKIPDPIKIPSQNDPDVMQARRQKMQDEFAKRQGRKSTDLTGGGAGGAYGRTTLG